MAKKTQIVCQHLENVSRTAFEEYQDIIREYVCDRHGIYALYSGTKLHYVGLASNLRAQLERHLRDRHKDSWDRFSVYLTIDGKAIKELETLLLRIVNPVGNRAGGRFVRSENLALHLKQSIRQRHREKEQELVPGKRQKTSKKKRAKKKARDNSVPLAQYVTRPMRMRVKYKGKIYRARLRRDGTIRYNGEIYKTPSGAAIAVRKRNTNGWQFWQCERAPGEWVPLSKIRE